MDQWVKEPLSLAGAVPEVNPIAMALRKEQPKCRADSQRNNTRKRQKFSSCLYIINPGTITGFLDKLNRTLKA